MRRGPLRQIVGEGHGRVGHEQQAGVPQVPQGQGQVVAAAAPAGRRRQLLVVRQDRFQERVPGILRRRADGFRHRAAGLVEPVRGDVPGPEQQPLHAGRPAVRRRLPLDNLLEVAQQVGVADGMKDPGRQLPVGRQAVVHGRAAAVRRPDVAAVPQAVERVLPVADHVQPDPLPRHPQRGLVHAGHRQRQDLLPQLRGAVRQPCGRPSAEGLDRARGQLHPVRVPQQVAQPRHRQVLHIPQVGRQLLQARAELHRPVHARGKRGPRAGPAAGAAHRLRPVLHHEQGRRLGQIVHLAHRRRPGGDPGQGGAAAPALRRPVVLVVVDPLRLHAGPPRMARPGPPAGAPATGVGCACAAAPPARPARAAGRCCRCAAPAAAANRRSPPAGRTARRSDGPPPPPDRPRPDGRPGRDRRPQGPAARGGTGRTSAQCGTHRPRHAKPDPPSGRQADRTGGT